jgi:hypothetical protein
LRTDNLSIYYRESTEHYIIVCPRPDTEAYFCTIIPDRANVQPEDCMCDPAMSLDETRFFAESHLALSDIEFDDLPQPVKVQYLVFRKVEQERSGLPLVPGAGGESRPFKSPQRPEGESSRPSAHTQQADETNGMAIASLVLGILSVPTTFCYGTGIFFGIAALITGLIARRRIRESDGALDGKRRALVGMIIGGGGIAVSVLIVVLTIFGPSIRDMLSSISQ